MASGNCCAQILWMKYILVDFGLNYQSVPIFCDNTSTINLTKNPIQHSKTKHIDIKHHFIRELVQNRKIQMNYVNTKDQLEDIFTKALSREQFTNLRAKLNICDFNTLWSMLMWFCLCMNVLLFVLAHMCKGNDEFHKSNSWLMISLHM